ncbi:hypothetical protein DBV14_09635 [Variovorax sp. KBW07]|uniref:hypothetical protein n=1 Tax=Variovorax sp. KBW07 TaxID=2153358 RepID=UPI000F560FE8|nr:hypothetical protein [Variovorax sp. KBW07]RQO57061.1 hypothetical protein DBV14_09635 [Variovorax sp. KBW07]
MSTDLKRRPVLHLVPKPHDTIDADWIASKVMENIDKEDPGFWTHHAVAARSKVRNTIVRAILAEGSKR